MPSKLRIGVVGLGRYAEIGHLPAYCNSPYAERIEVAAACDLDVDRLGEVAGRHKIPGRYADYAEMFARERLDAACVVTPDHTHTPIVLAALGAGLDVLVEKPLAMTVGECNAVIQAARKAGRRVRTDFHKRLDPSHEDAHSRLAAGAFGPVQFGYVWMQDAISVPVGDFFRSDLPAHSSPVWFLGVHFFDCIRFITGLQPYSVTAAGYRQVIEPEKGIPTWDAVKSDFVFDNGAAISFFVSWNLPANIPSLTRQGIYLQCARGELVIDTRDRGFYESTDAGGYKAVNSAFSRNTPDGVKGYGHESIGEILMEFLAIRDNGPDYRRQREQAEPSGLDGLWAAVMGQATDESLARGRKVDGGRVVLGTTVLINDLLERELGTEAAPYRVKLTQ